MGLVVVVQPHVRVRLLMTDQPATSQFRAMVMTPRSNWGHGGDPGGLECQGSKHEVESGPW